MTRHQLAFRDKGLLNATCGGAYGVVKATEGGIEIWYKYAWEDFDQRLFKFIGKRIR